ncbi:kinase-like domain-containing protein [Xylogone sp. PMI_703]|nr:kinase-like domain-containing protein [Xylogone sp. PMI_703]
MASSIRAGQRLEGKLGSYTLSTNLHKDIWAATNPKLEKVVVKIPPRYRFDNERRVLEHFRGRAKIRQVLDEIQEPPSLVFRYFDDNVLSASNSRRLATSEVKFVAKGVLEALRELHRDGYVHTDVKPDNISVNYGSGTSRFNEVELGDYGDACFVDPKDHLKLGEEGHVIGAYMFRSPEAMLNLRWGTPTDIWSFGATLISLIWGSGWHIFKPDPRDAGPDDETYPNHVFIKQIAYFGPFPSSYFDFLPQDDEAWEWIVDATQYIVLNNKWKPIAMAEDPELSREDRTFICKIMKLDPRERPTAKELLEDPWFRDV